MWSIDSIAARLIVLLVVCPVFVAGSSVALEQGDYSIDTKYIDSVVQSMVDDLYAKARQSGAKGVQTKYIRFEGIAWESPDGDIAGTSTVGAYLGGRVERALSEKSTVLSPEDSDQAKGFWGTIVRGSYKVGKAGVRVVLRMADKSSGSVISEVSRELGLEAFPGLSKSELLPPVSGEAQALGALISRALGGSESDFALRLSTDQGNYGSYVEGENLTIFLESDKDCHVRVYHVSMSDRKMALIFPNRSEQDGFLRAGQVRAVPGAMQDYAITVTKPYGVDAIFAVASLEPFGDEEALRAGWAKAEAASREKGRDESKDDDTWADDDSWDDDSWDDDSWDDDSWDDGGWWDDEDLEWTDNYVVRSNINDQQVEEVMAKGLMITKKPPSTGSTGSLEWGNGSPLSGAAPDSGQKGKARATCYFSTVQKLF
ncbi:MAG: DUF4384 domain-containing protein [Candidatus Latescibacterota bacterium]|nr:MAG: DUF4384 domain-containing protein [Candidatus Latescibacterota bacterium]